MFAEKFSELSVWQARQNILSTAEKRKLAKITFHDCKHTLRRRKKTRAYSWYLPNECNADGAGYIEKAFKQWFFLPRFRGNAKPLKHFFGRQMPLISAKFANLHSFIIHANELFCCTFFRHTQMENEVRQVVEKLSWNSDALNSFWRGKAIFGSGWPLKLLFNRWHQL